MRGALIHRVGRTAAIVLAVCAWAAAARGADLGFHAVDAVNQNHCKMCHDTAQGEPRLRGWVVALPAAPGDWAGKGLSALCYMCHESNGGSYGAHNMSNNAYAGTSHGFVVGQAPREPEGSPQGSYYPAISASALPYAAAAELECTSCHNVHRATDRPFLQRATIQGLCDSCHAGRANGGSLDTFDGFTRQYSTHPTGQFLADTAGANIKDVDTVDAALKTLNPEGEGWALGGHLGDPAGNTGLVECQTCHAVHGPALSTPGLPKLLSIDNVTPASSATPSRLCEGCHYGGGAGEQVGTAAQAGLPAGQYSDHPVDALTNRAFYPTGVALPFSWLSANTPNLDGGAQPFYLGTAEVPVCSSCHDTHGGIVGTPLLRGPQPSAGWAMSYDDWCFSCHAAAQMLPAAHHSTRRNLAIALEDAVDSLLSCGDCHGPAGTTDWRAHNGFWAWPAAAPYAPTSGAFCLGCHSGADPADLVAPALKGQTFADPAPFPASHGTPRGGGSHYLGPDSGEFAGVEPLLTAWSSGYFSSYGAPNTAGGGDTAPAAAGEIICQSCHHVLWNDGRAHPALYGDGSTAKAGWRSNLLLEPYEDDPPGTGSGTGAAAVGSALCTGCHQAAGSHHPQTGGTLTIGPRANLALTTGAGSYADQTSAPVGGGAAPGTLSYPDDDQVDCDSCHRPHRADSDSDVAAAAHGDKTSPAPWDSRPTRHILEVDGTSHVYSDLCDECHTR